MLYPPSPHLLTIRSRINTNFFLTLIHEMFIFVTVYRIGLNCRSSIISN